MASLTRCKTDVRFREPFLDRRMELIHSAVRWPCSLLLPIVPGGSLGGNRGGRLGDVQMAAGVAEHDPRRRLARGTRNGNRGRLSRLQYRLEPRDCGFVPRALLGSHHDVKAVRLVDVVDQGGEALTELRPMAGHGSYVRRLDRCRSGNGECCGG